MDYIPRYTVEMGKRAWLGPANCLPSCHVLAVRLEDGTGTHGKSRFYYIRECCLFHHRQVSSWEPPPTCRSHVSLMTAC